MKVISFVRKCVESKTNHKTASRHLPSLTERIQDAKFKSGRMMRALQCKNSPGVDRQVKVCRPHQTHRFHERISCK